MNIGFDGKRATQNFTGLGNYSRYIIGVLSNYFPHNSYHIYAVKEPEQEIKINNTTYHFPSPQKRSWFWRSFGISKDLVQHKINLFHGLSNEIPFGLKKVGIRSVVTIHDLIFLRYPEYYNFIDRQIYKFKFRYAAENADKVIVISEQTKRDVIDFFNINANKVEVIYQSCSPIFRRKISLENRNSVTKKYNLPEKYILNIGTIEPRKNLMLIVNALQYTKGVELVVIGKETGYADNVKQFIESASLKDRVHFVNNVSQGDLPAIYQSCEIFVYPSRFEGFGIPILEALYSEVPVIAATGSCLEEAGGRGSSYVDPDDEHQLAAEINDVLHNPEKRKEMIAMGIEHLKKFDDEHIAEQLVKLYKNVIKNA